MLNIYLIVGNFRDNLISRFLKGDISQHLIFVILENFLHAAQLMIDTSVNEFCKIWPGVEWPVLMKHQVNLYPLFGFHIESKSREPVCSSEGYAVTNGKKNPKIKKLQH